MTPTHRPFTSRTSDRARLILGRPAWRRRGLAGATLALSLAIANVAEADTRSHFASAYLLFDNDVSLPRFDPALGTLNSVTLTLTGTVDVYIELINYGDDAATVVTRRSAVISLLRPSPCDPSTDADGCVTTTVRPTVEVTSNMTARDGWSSPTTAAGARTGRTGSVTSTPVLVSVIDLPSFIGSGTVKLPIASSMTGTTTGLTPDILNGGRTSSSANVRLTYDYTPAPAASDADGDGVPDTTDACPGFADSIDADQDGTADGCDACPIDAFNDSDGDGSCDSGDACPLDSENDVDSDGICAEDDLCAIDPDNDADGDEVCGDVDACPDDPFNDADADGVCGNVDVCLEGDDDADADGDGAADACDGCPLDAANDADSDGICADSDTCPLDLDNDADADSVCANDDPCPLDPLDDLDADGMCGDLDPCPADGANDADGDGLCESVDNCATVANPNQSDVDADTIGDLCEPDNDADGVHDDDDNCPLDVNQEQADGDADGSGDACDTDDDGDAVADGADVCLGTTPGRPVLANGCDVDQQCPCASPWKNHGAYVSCVSNSAQSLFAAGKISAGQKATITSAAAQSVCGKKSCRREP